MLAVLPETETEQGTTGRGIRALRTNIENWLSRTTEDRKWIGVIERSRLSKSFWERVKVWSSEGRGDQRRFPGMRPCLFKPSLLLLSDGT